MGGFAPQKYAIPTIFRATREKSKESASYKMQTNEPDAPCNGMEPRALPRHPEPLMRAAHKREGSPCHEKLNDKSDAPGNGMEPLVQSRLPPLESVLLSICCAQRTKCEGSPGDGMQRCESDARSNEMETIVSQLVYCWNNLKRSRARPQNHVILGG